MWNNSEWYGLLSQPAGIQRLCPQPGVDAAVIACNGTQGKCQKELPDQLPVTVFCLCLSAQHQSPIQAPLCFSWAIWAAPSRPIAGFTLFLLSKLPNSLLFLL